MLMNPLELSKCVFAKLVLTFLNELQISSSEGERLRIEINPPSRCWAVLKT